MTSATFHFFQSQSLLCLRQKRRLSFSSLLFSLPFLRHFLTICRASSNQSKESFRGSKEDIQTAAILSRGFTILEYSQDTNCRFLYMLFLEFSMRGKIRFQEISRFGF